MIETKQSCKHAERQLAECAYLGERALDMLQIRSIDNVEDGDLGRVGQIVQQLGRQQEALRRARAASSNAQQLEHLHLSGIMTSR